MFLLLFLLVFDLSQFFAFAFGFACICSSRVGVFAFVFAGICFISVLVYLRIFFCSYLVNLLIGSASSPRCNQSGCGVSHLGVPCPSSEWFVRAKGVCQY